jgi:hypothetical protein
MRKLSRQIVRDERLELSLHGVLAVALSVG